MSSNDNSRSERARLIFRQVLDAPASRSDDLLASLCSGDSELESEVTRLLAAHERAAAEGFLDGAVPTLDSVPVTDHAARESATVESGVEAGAGPSGVGTSPEESPPGPPVVIPKYTLLHRIGEGQFAQVWLAQHEWLEHLCAIRLFERVSAGEVDSLRTYKRVAANHAHLVPIEEVGLAGDWVYCVMPRADNAATGDDAMTTSGYQAMTLRKHLKRRGRLGVEEVAGIGADLMSGVAHLHEKDLVHQDIKPENILSIDGTWRLADFGLLGREGGRRGYTPGYNPPDSDVGCPYHDRYALGVTLFELLSGNSADYFSRIQLQQDIESEADPQRRGLLECILGLCSDRPPRGFVSDRDAEAKLRLLASPPPAAGRGGGSSRGARTLRTAIGGGAAALVVIAAMVALLAWWAPNSAGPELAGQPGSEAASVPDFQFGGVIREAYVEVYRAASDDSESVKQPVKVAPGNPEPAHVREGDALRFVASFKEPAYVYLVALAASGGDEFLCWPASKIDAPEPIRTLEFPPPSPGEIQDLWNLEEGPGLHAFALIASAEPLPAYEQWRDSVGAPPWPENTGAVLADSATDLTPMILTKLGIQRLSVSRAPGQRRVLPGPVQTLSAHLRRLGPNHEAVAYVVPVRPAE